MHCNTERPRKKLRLSGYDYRTPGYYFVTICTNNRECLFGNILNGSMHLNAAGQMIELAWRAIPDRYLGWNIDSLIVMPNHIHAIVILSETGPAQGPAPTLALSELIRNIKSYTTTCYRHGVYKQLWPSFFQQLWQRSYHEHIIRDSKSLEKIRQYILNNPAQWEFDQENPQKINIL